MYATVPKIMTSFPWQEIAGYHPRQVRERQAGDFQCIEGVLVDDGPKAQDHPVRGFQGAGQQVTGSVCALPNVHVIWAE